MGLFGPPDVKKLAERGNVQKLLKVVRYERSSQIRRQAVCALGKIGDQETIGGLVQALKDSNNCVRQEAETALREIMDRLVQVFKDSSQVGKEEAEGILRSMLDGLVQALKGTTS
jgi:HEAT repeat protein